MSLKTLMCYIYMAYCFPQFLNVFLRLFVDGHLDWKYKHFLWARNFCFSTAALMGSVCLRPASLSPQPRDPDHLRTSSLILCFILWQLSLHVLNIWGVQFTLASSCPQISVICFIELIYKHFPSHRTSEKSFVLLTFRAMDRSATKTPRWNERKYASETSNASNSRNSGSKETVWKLWFADYKGIHN